MQRLESFGEVFHLSPGGDPRRFADLNHAHPSSADLTRTILHESFLALSRLEIFSRSFVFDRQGESPVAD